MDATKLDSKTHAPGPSFGKRDAWWATLPSNPFRLFFPAGLLFGVIGVGHWVLWSAGWNIPNVALVHASLQAQGFLASFVIGFLMTAFPRFTGTWPAARLELAVMFAALFSFFIALLRHDWIAAQLFFLAAMLDLAFFAGRRVRHRNKPLPSSFLLMGFGVLHAVLGPLFIIISRFGAADFALFSTGRQMVQVGFLLCMVLGVTGKLAPFLLGYTDDPVADAGRQARFSSGKAALVFHGLTGSGLLASFFIDNVNPHIGAGLRAVLTTLHLVSFARIARPLKKKTTLMLFFHISTWMVPLGLWVAFLWPAFRIAALHIMFLVGFSLMIFSFGMLIVLSHSGKAAALNSRLIPMKATGTLVLVALISRFLAEVIPSQYRLLIHLSSGLWVLAALTWGCYTLPKIFRPGNPAH
jgi:uncharacterized protein involved in response to NO